MVTVGFAAGDAVPAPAAIRPMTIATASEIAYAALAARRLCFRTTCPPSKSVGLPSLSLRFRFRSARRHPLNETEQYGGREGQRGDAERGGDHAFEAVTRLVDDDLAESAATRDRGDRGSRDHEDRCDPDSGHDERQTERQFHLGEDLAFAQAHAARGFDDVPVDAGDAEVRVRQDGRDREDDERSRVVPEADAEDRQAECDQHETRKRASDARDAEREEEPAMAVAEEKAERQREEDRNRERRERQLEMLGGLAQQQTRVVGDELERVEERPGVELRGDRHVDLLHGVSARVASTSSESATSASAMQSPP